MELNSGLFVLFLSGVCAVAYLWPRRLRYVWLLVASYIFYLYSPGSWQQNLPALGLLLCSTLVSYAATLVIGGAKKLWLKRTALILSLVCCLGLLLACKYYDFFAVGVYRASGFMPRRLNLVLPLGISYYTLQTISYTADVYLGKQTAEKNPLLYALYVSFFPGIVTGPINRAPDMLPQYKNPPRFEYNRVAGGFFRILWGFIKKMVIADNLARFTSAVLGNVAGHSGPELCIAALLFAYQLYVDFGGSCDIAIGAARMLGFTFAENFKRPFSAKTYSGLWQRWHISLTSFFRDYVFTPLVWSRWTEKLPFLKKWATKPPVNSSVLIIFTLSGLWHGPSMGYVIWGLLNGLVMTVAKLLSKPKERLVAHIPLYRNTHVRGVFQRIFVYLLFAGCLVFFSASLYGTTVTEFLQNLVGGWQLLGTQTLATRLAVNGLDFTAALLLFAGVVFIELLEMFGVKAKTTMADWIRTRPVLLRWSLYYLLLAALIVFGVFGQSAFIYQQY